MQTGLRILFGFIGACIAAGITTVLFIETPLEISQLAGIPMLEKISELAVLALRVATHSAIFSAPFVLLIALVGEWAHIRNWLYYTGAGMIIAALGFLLQYASEVDGQATIVNSYATLAFLTTGFLGGFVYWLVAGRRAGGHHADPEFVYEPAERSPLFRRNKSDKLTEATPEIPSDKAHNKAAEPSSSPSPQADKTPIPSLNPSHKPTGHGNGNRNNNKDRGTSVPVTNQPSRGGSKPTKP